MCRTERYPLRRKGRYRRTLERAPAIKAKTFLRESDQANAVAA
jgi:hypothetical protein